MSEQAMASIEASVAEAEAQEFGIRVENVTSADVVAAVVRAQTELVAEEALQLTANFLGLVGAARQGGWSVVFCSRLHEDAQGFRMMARRPEHGIERFLKAVRDGQGKLLGFWHIEERDGGALWQGDDTTRAFFSNVGEVEFMALGWSANRALRECQGAFWREVQK